MVRRRKAAAREWVAWFVPESTSRQAWQAAYADALLLNRLGLAGIVLGGAFAFVYGVLFHSGAGAVALAAAGLVATLAPVLYRWTGSRTLATHLLVADLVVVGAFVSFIRPGFAISSLGFSALVPIIALYLVDLRAAAWWTAIAAAVSVGLFVLVELDVGPGSFVVVAPEGVWQINDLFAILGLLGVTLLVIAAYEKRGELIAANARRVERLFEQSQRLESVGQLAAGVAHEFNNQLSVIQASIDVALEGASPDDPWRRELQEAARASRSSAALTGQLLALTRQSDGSEPATDPNLVIRELGDLLHRTLREDIELDLRLRASRQVELARSRFEQLIVNLVTNARDAMPQGGTIAIETDDVIPEDVEPPLGADGELCRVRVIDSGQGMPPEVAERAFEPFFSTKPRDRGTGLGLFTVYGIATVAGGAAVVESSSSRGTTISVYLPARPGRAATDEPGPPREPDAAATAPPAGSDGPADEPRPTPRPPRAGAGTVLVVEDESAVRRSLERSIRRWGYSVLGAGDGVEALEVIETTPTVDVVVTDVVMPRMSGAELGRELATRCPDVPVVYMSGYADPAAGTIPTDELLQKPFELEELRRRLRAAVAGGESGD